MTRNPAGKPMNPIGRTITPRFSSASHSSCALRPVSRYTKLATDGTTMKPSVLSSVSRKARPCAANSTERRTYSASSSAASAATCARLETLKGERTLLSAAMISGWPMP